MSYAERIARLSSPRDGMVALAEGIDAILAKLDNQPAQTDPWGDWSTTTAEAPQPAQPAFRRPALDVVAIGHVQEALRVETDAENVQALQARLRMLQDPGRLPASEVADGTYVEADEDGIVDLPPPSPEKFSRRFHWALENKLGSQFLGLDEDTLAAEAYAKGGPMWLYLGNRAAVMQMPPEWRRGMVYDVQEDSPRQAQEFARDVLKDTDADGARSVTLAAIDGD